MITTPVSPTSDLFPSFMKMLRPLLIFSGLLVANLIAAAAPVTTALTPGSGGKIVVEATGVPPPAPLFFTATAEQMLLVGTGEITSEVKLAVRVIQGSAEVLTLGLSGEGEVAGVTGTGLRDWSVRQGVGEAAGKRFLDLRAVMTEGVAARSLELVVRTRMRSPAVPGATSLLLVTAGDAVGFSSRVRLQPDPTVELRVTQANGVVTVGGLDFMVQGEPRIEVTLARRGAGWRDAELTAMQLTGVVNEPAGSVDFKLRAQARVEQEGARMKLLSGGAALNGPAAGDGWHVELVKSGNAAAYDLVFDRKGAVTVELTFAASTGEAGDWRKVNFRMPAGAVVPVVLSGLEANGVEFDPAQSVVPLATAAGWQGFLPASGVASLAWKRTREAGVETLSFTSAEQTEVRVGAGLLRQSSQIAFRILQGSLNAVRLRIDGPGEIVGVEGANVLGWSVTERLQAGGLPGEGRVLEVKLSRPFEGEGLLTVRSQSALGGFPVRAEAVRLTPEGGVRHAGFVRVANTGAVRLEVAEVEGMMQLAPEQFPGGAVETGARQVFVYRFPSAEHGYRVLASQILPEVGVSAVVTYELAETDRIINADLELDVREAPLRDWSLEVPEDYAVVTVQGAGVADYAVESAVREGRRTLKVLFEKAVEGRQLVRLRLEKNQAAGAGEWVLAPLAFPGAKSVRGHVGAVSAPGYRITPGAARELVEVPLSYFPRQTAGLQQAWRLREAGWAAAVKIEALGQSVQADVFHLYSLKQGVVYGSVLINYFVIGAPAGEWRIEVPATVGNIDVTGQGVRREWRREGNQVIVALHQPVLGAATLLVTFEQPMSARGGVIHPGEVRPLGVQSERGFLQVVSPLQVKNEIKKAEGALLKLEPLELPAELRLLTTSPSLAVYQYTARPFTLELGMEWYQPGETVEQVVDFAKLSSKVARDGQVVTEARFFVKTRGRKALRLELPAGVKLWEARVDGEVVNARADGGHTLVPLPPRLNPNEPVDVVLRLGQAAGGSAGHVTVAAPKMSAPMVIGEWTLHADSGRLLVTGRGNAELVRPNLTERGFEWLSERGRGVVIALMLLVAAAVLALRAQSGRWLPFGLLAGAVAVVFALGMALEAAGSRRVNLGHVDYAATVVPADTAVTIEVANVESWRAMVSWPGVAAAAVGLLLLGASLLRGRFSGGLFAAAGGVLLSLGLLAQRLGAVGFFVMIAAAVFLFGLLPGLRRSWRAWRTWRSGDSGDGPENEGPAEAAPLLIAVLLAGVALGLGAPEARAEKAAPVSDPWMQESAKAAQSLVQRWEIRDGRLFAEVEFTVRGAPGDSFLLLKAPAVLTQFSGEGLRVGKIVREGTAAYVVSMERAGTLPARVKFELPVPDITQTLALPTGPAAVQRITIQLDQGGWEFRSPAAVQVLPETALAAGRSGATLVLGPAGAPVIQFTPQKRNLSAETTQYYAETASLFTPGPGVVNGYTRVTVRPVQGRVAALELEVPEGFTVGEVGKGPAGAWRFNPGTRRLQVAIEPAQAEAFSIVVELQRGTAALPYDLALRPVRVNGASGEVGMVALAFGGDAQPEGVKSEGLSPVNMEDFDATLLPKSRDGQPLAVLQQVYRYGGDGGTVTLRVAPVAPEVRVMTKQVLSFGADRLVLAADLNVAITRVGLFKLSFALPDGLEVESLSGPALSHWTEAREAARRVVTLHLNGRTIGEQRFALTLAGPAPAAQASWTVPRVLVREATRHTGELQLVPEKGLRLQAMERTHVSQLDPRTVGNTRPGALAFRLLQEDWALAVGIEALEPWVTVQALQEVTAREGQTLTRIGLKYKVENAAVKILRVRLPGLSAEQARTVRATGPAVSDFAAVAGEPERWEIRFQRGIVGETEVQIEFQAQAGREQGREQVATPVFENVRQAVQFVAVRGGGRLELEVAETPRGWQRIDWAAVPAGLQDRGDRSVPALAFRVAEPEKPLEITVRRHEVADALKLRVTGGELTTVFSPEGSFLTAAELSVEVVEKSTLRVRLPEGSRLFNTLVNGESVSVVREGDEYLFHVMPSTAAGRVAKVRIVYAVTQAQGARVALRGPGLNVPLENVSWRVVIPAGYALDGYGGGLQLREEEAAGSFGLGDYQSLIVSKRAAEVKQATDFITEANVLLQKGQQQQAGEVLSRAFNANALDQATNEDARVQLRALKTQQAVLGLNTRRQKLYLDNTGGGATKNEQLEQAANLNPFLQGRMNYDPQQADQLLMGNTVEENSALRGIAGRIVDQQLATEPAPGAIDVTLPEKGRVLIFTRSLQVDGGAPLELQLEVSPARRSGMGFGIVVLLATGGIVALFRRRPIRT
ncbi:MAG: hypothetical protein K0R17_3140 [Rariglobus sp.]|jgi:hypothetical protein|nr:hypothetical protein [Rariglobus sp.]